MPNQGLISSIVARQRDFFNAGSTRQYKTRIDCLLKLKASLITYEAELHAARKHDLGKSEFEAFVSETGYCRYEITETVKNLSSWMKPRRVGTSITGLQPENS